jgi:hypothetical protein
MRKSVHHNRQLDPPQPSQQQQPSVNVKGGGFVSSINSSPYTKSRQAENYSLEHAELSAGINSHDVHYREETSGRYVRSYANSLRSDSSEYSLPQSDNSSRFYPSSSKGKAGTQRSLNDTWNVGGDSESQSSSDDSSVDVTHTSLTPNSENDNQPSSFNKNGQRKYVNPDSVDDAGAPDDDALDPDRLGFTEARYSSKHLTSAPISRTSRTKSKNSNSRKNGDAFSSSSNDTTSEEEDNDIPMMNDASKRSSTMGPLQRYPRRNISESPPSTTNENSVVKSLSSSFAPPQQQQQKDDKIATMLKQRKLSRHSASSGHAATSITGSAFDQALEHVKTSSNIPATTSSNIALSAKDGLKPTSRKPVSSQSALHSARRNESGTVIGSFHLPHPDSPSFLTQKNFDSKERGSMNIKDRGSSTEGNIRTSKTSVLSGVDSHVVNNMLNQDHSNSPVGSVRTKNISESEKLKSLESFDDILSLPSMIPENGQQPSLSHDFHSLDALDSVTAEQKQSQHYSSSAASSTQHTVDSIEGSMSAIALETSSLPSGTSLAGSQAGNTASGPPHPRRQTSVGSTSKHRPKNEDLASGVLPDVLMTMREKLESLSLFDSDMMKLAQPGSGYYSAGVNGKGPFEEETEEERLAKESLQRSFQQSISAAVLVSLAHKRYERRRLAAMEVWSYYIYFIHVSSFLSTSHGVSFC